MSNDQKQPLPDTANYFIYLISSWLCYDFVNGQMQTNTNAHAVGFYDNMKATPKSLFFWAETEYFNKEKSKRWLKQL